MLAMFAQKQTELLVSQDVTYHHVQDVKELTHKGLVRPILDYASPV